MEKQEILAKVEEIAKHLEMNHNFTLENYWAGNLWNEMGRIYLRMSGGVKGKGTASFNTSDLFLDQKKDLVSEISFSLDKPAVAIARDIERRLMPSFLVAMPLIAARLKEQADFNAAKTWAGGVLREAFGEPQERKNFESDEFSYNVGENTYGKVQVNSGETCKITINSCNVNLACKIAKLLREELG